ncbi:Spy/CpxP family protein refolding chaperone [Lysobacter claricitrinus]|uniref:Spy/CpxP family protein refolding chaperone n=1 Tax=Lysobacter claricitrinus TaxID=3367728 RepID=UPI0038B31449
MLVRGLTLGAALCVGGVATYAATAPSALAATVTAGIDGGSWIQHLHGHADVHAHVDQVLAKAGATEAQRQQIESITHEAMAAEHADMARYHASLGEMKRLLAAPRIDVAAVERVRSQQDQFLLDTNRRLTETLLRTANVLTPAQRQALSAEIDGMMANRIGHHHAG